MLIGFVGLVASVFSTSSTFATVLYTFQFFKVATLKTAEGFLWNVVEGFSSVFGGGPSIGTVSVCELSKLFRRRF